MPMDDNERESVKDVISLARLAIIAMMVVSGYMAQDILLGMV